MIKNKLKLAIALGCVLGAATPASVFATNGMFLIGTGTKARGMGGVGITMTHDTFASAANPATMARIDGNRFDIGGDVFTAPVTSTMGQAPNMVCFGTSHRTSYHIFQSSHFFCKDLSST